MSNDASRLNPRAPHSLRWGLVVGLVIALVDTISVIAERSMSPESPAAPVIAMGDQLINVVLFSVLGLRLGRATGIPRLAAESGVLAGAIAGTVAIVMMVALPAATLPESPVREMIGTMALNIAMGGVLSLLNGWLGARAERAGRSNAR